MLFFMLKQEPMLRATDMAQRIGLRSFTLKPNASVVAA
jgi:hypothetical protein